jgi:hypothetical protein
VPEERCAQLAIPCATAKVLSRLSSNLLGLSCAMWAESTPSTRGCTSAQASKDECDATAFLEPSAKRRHRSLSLPATNQRLCGHMLTDWHCCEAESLERVSQTNIGLLDWNLESEPTTRRHLTAEKLPCLRDDLETSHSAKQLHGCTEKDSRAGIAPSRSQALVGTTHEGHHQPCGETQPSPLTPVDSQNADVEDFSPTMLRAVMLSTPEKDARRLRAFLETHLQAGDRLEVTFRSPADIRFQTTFHVSWFAIRSAYCKAADARSYEAGTPRPKQIDVSFMTRHNPRSVWLYELRTSCVISRLDGSRWTASLLTGPYADAHQTADEGTLDLQRDPVTQSPTDMDCMMKSIDSMAEFRGLWLTVVQIRLHIIADEWHAISDLVQDYIQEAVSSTVCCTSFTNALY